MNKQFREIKDEALRKKIAEIGIGFDNLSSFIEWEILKTKWAIVRNKRKLITFDVSGEGIYRHEVGNINCTEGWCECEGWPKKCTCGGLIHADFGDEGSDCDYWLYKKCDRCGDDYEEVGEI